MFCTNFHFLSYWEILHERTVYDCTRIISFVLIQMYLKDQNWNLWQVTSKYFVTILFEFHLNYSFICIYKSVFFTQTLSITFWVVKLNTNFFIFTWSKSYQRNDSWQSWGKRPSKSVLFNFIKFACPNKSEAKFITFQAPNFERHTQNQY